MNIDSWAMNFGSLFFCLLLDRLREVMHVAASDVDGVCVDLLAIVAEE